nr:uncharacterized protein LOC117279957 [Nicotiana tomentosiformis]
MVGNEGRPMIKVARPNLANMTQAIVNPEITGHFELKQYMVELIQSTGQYVVADELLGHTFVDGLDEASKMNLDSACGCSCMARPYSEIQILLNNFTTNYNNWQVHGEARRALKQKAAGVIKRDDFSSMRVDIVRLANQMNKMIMHQAQQIQHVQQMSTCSELCGEGHTSDICPVNPESIYYNIRPPTNYNHPPQPPQQSEESLTDMMKKLVLDNQKENQQLRTSFRNLERQFGLMANNQNIRPVGALPSDTEKNSQVNSVTLRNGRELVEVAKKKKKAVWARRRKSAKTGRDMLKKIHLNIPLVDMLREVPKYAKYTKDIVANKRRLTEFVTGALTEKCTSRIQYKLPQKLKDPGSFTIPVRIGEIDVGRALCDLGSSINLMPLSMFKQLGLGALRPTSVLLQLADISCVYPEGVIEDVLLQIGKFIFPADFIILDYEADELVPIILGRTLLATRDAIIKVREGKMILRVDNEEVVFNVYRAIQFPRHFEDLAIISMMKINEPAVETSAFKEDSLEKALMLFNHLELEEEVEEMLQILDASCEYIRERSQFEPLDRPIGLSPRPSVEEAPKLELKPLPSHLHYVYLGRKDLRGDEGAQACHCLAWNINTA